MTKESFATLYRKLFAENKIKSKVDLARQLSVDGYSVGKAYIGQVLNPDMPDKGVSEGLEKAVYKVYKAEMTEIEKPATSVTGGIQSPDVIVLLTELIRESREDRKMIIESQATISKTAQAAIDAAQSAAKTADLLATRFGIIEEKTADDAAMIRGIQEVLVTFVAPRLPNTSPQEIGAALGNAVIRSAAEAKKKKKGTRTAASR